MNLTIHRQYELRNTATKQTAIFEVLELYNYKGQSILYGERMRQGIWIPAKFGRRQASPGPACFPVFPDELASDVTQLVDQLHSLPLYLVLSNNPDDGLKLLPILSLQNSSNILGGQRYGKDGMIQRAQQLIDLYLDWKPTRLLPKWFHARRAMAKDRENAASQ